LKPLANKNQPSRTDFLIIFIVWCMSSLRDRVWIALDHAIPGWDQTHHLTGTLNYLHALQNAQWLSREWWRNLWMLSSKNPPLTYILSAPFQQIFGRGEDQALLVMLLFSAILLVVVYSLGKQLFNRRVGLLAAIICAIIPGLYRYQLQFLIDYPLTTVVVASFASLTFWKDAKSRRKQWLWAILTGICLGCALMIKQGALFFLIFPLAVLIAQTLISRRWGRIPQLVVSFTVAGIIFIPWYSTNWIYVIGNYQQGIVDAGASEGDPTWQTIAGWLYYPQKLPDLFTFPLLVVAVAGMMLYAVRVLLRWQGREKNKDWPQKNRSFTPKSSQSLKSALIWIAWYLLPAYIICSIFANKDTRYMMPAFPVLAILVAGGLSLFSHHLRCVQWGTIGLVAVLMLVNVFPLGITWGISQPFYPYTQQPYPHAEVVRAIIEANPHLQATVGVIADTGQLNHNNFNYYGALADFQVYGREVGVRDRYLDQDVRSLNWYITKTGNSGSTDAVRQKMVERLETSPDLELYRTWDLPDNSHLNLYHRRNLLLQIEPLDQAQNRVQLDRVIIPKTAPPGQPIPVTYEWSGPWSALQSGVVLMTWKQSSVISHQLPITNYQLPITNYQLPITNYQLPITNYQLPINSSPKPLLVGDATNNQQQITNNQQQNWFHDRGIGGGQLYGKLEGAARVMEQTAMLPPPNVTPGVYALEATYLSRESGQTYELDYPPVTIAIDPQATARAAPEVDLVTQLRTLAVQLPTGMEAFEGIFDQIGRINQYDPVQDYVKQAEVALKARLEQDPQNVDLAYALAFTQILQENARSAIASLKTVVRLDPDNPYAHAYLAFVYLYTWQPQAADMALKPALASRPDLLEFKALEGLSALMQGQIGRAWRILSPLLEEL
jgi:4-amino-4-deoxy-L-arabinose transferase-like glycosyltransferase/tetratricopeptide (TPR) repeat protein